MPAGYGGLYYWVQYPIFECFSFIAKILLYLYRLRVNALGGHILMKVFFAFVLQRKCGSFHSSRTTDSTHFLYSYVAVRILRTYTSYYPSVGYCIVYYCIGLSTTFFEINENQLHTFFLYNIAILELYGNIV